MKKIISVVTSFAMVMTFALSASAAVLFQYDDLLVENTESWQYIYDGYLQTNLRTLYKGNRADRGYIRYSGGNQGDTGRLYTSYSRGSRVSVSKRYYDTLNPWAPKVHFNYGFEWTPGSIHDVF